MKAPETQYAKGRDGFVAYQVIGEGPLDLVFIPDWVTNLEIMWEEPSLARFLRRLSSFSRLICFDKRGCGLSDPVLFHEGWRRNRGSTTRAPCCAPLARNGTRCSGTPRPGVWRCSMRPRFPSTPPRL